MSTLIRAGLLPDYRDTISRLGGDPETAIAIAGVDPALLTSPDTFIPYTKFRALLVAATKVTGCERFGLYMSENLGPQSLGVVGYAMQQADTVLDAFYTLSKYLHLHDQHGQITINDESRTVRIQFAIEDLNSPGAPQAIDIAAVIAHNLMLALLGEEVEPERMDFPYSRPADTSPYEFLNCQKLGFDAPHYSIQVSREIMYAPIPNRDPRMSIVLADYMRQLDNRYGTQHTEKVERIVADLLSTGDCTLERVAEFFGVTARTLQNWLKQEDCTFHGILEDVRRKLAIQYLETGGMRLTDISLLLGYSESSVFTRSFKRWYGESPSRWRKRLKT